MSIPACIPIRPRPAPSSGSSPAAQAPVDARRGSGWSLANGSDDGRFNLSSSHGHSKAHEHSPGSSFSRDSFRSGTQAPSHAAPPPASLSSAGAIPRPSSQSQAPLPRFRYNHSPWASSRAPDSQHNFIVDTMNRQSSDANHSSMRTGLTPIAPRPQAATSSSASPSTSLAPAAPVSPKVAHDLALDSGTGKGKSRQRTTPPPSDEVDGSLGSSRSRRTAANNARHAMHKAVKYDGSSGSDDGGSANSSDLSDPEEEADGHYLDDNDDNAGRVFTSASAGTSVTSQRQSSGSRPPSSNSSNKKSRMSGSNGTQSQSQRTNKNGRKKLPKAPPLDLSTVRTSAPAVMPTRITERLFGLEHCPIFYPTVDEFAEPLEYIERIAKQAREHQHGICKVVPPEGWQPPFSLNTETFRFGTRVQQLNSLEASARAQLNFIEQLTIFHRQQKHSRFQIPKLGGRQVDLWHLRKEVNASGGFDVVCSSRRWSQVARSMGYDVEKDHGTTAVLRTAYQKIVQPFEDYRLRIKSSYVNGSPGGEASNSGGMRSMANAGSGKASLSTAAVVTAQQVQAASAKLNDALAASPSAGPSRTSTPLSVQLPDASSRATSADEPALSAGEFCEICRSEEDEESILLCDECDKGYHMRCLDPPLNSVPKGDWICDACIVNKGDDFGFEEGEDHSLSSFHEAATEFRRDWLSKYPAPTLGTVGLDAGRKGKVNWDNELLVEDHVEREFWRLIESPKETVEVEYGADIHTTKWGSAVPTIESHPKEPYARDGWNLNNLPILPGSILRYVKSDICGMTVPWAYVGMMFSTFAWHKEDHNTYSVNYHHIGGTKTWYGVPGEDDEKLEAAVKDAAPELFEQQPDLMYQLVTLMSPGKLKAAGVRVSACDQRPNEFVITFPKAYHAGFNHDFNYNEAVNFCLQDWLPYDLEAVQKYKAINKSPVFSHDELLMTIYSYETSHEAAVWLVPLFEEMVIRELGRRKVARLYCPNLLEVLETAAYVEDDQYQCLVDKSFCYLSQITSEGHPEVACVDHSTHLPEGKKVLKTRHTDAELREMLSILKQRASPSSASTNSGHHSKRRPEESDYKAQEAKRPKVDLAINPARPSSAMPSDRARAPWPTMLPPAAYRTQGLSYEASKSIPQTAKY